MSGNFQPRLGIRAVDQIVGRLAQYTPWVLQRLHNLALIAQKLAGLRVIPATTNGADKPRLLADAEPAAGDVYSGLCNHEPVALVIVLLYIA